eukprot:1161475-Pelagomonas_calceolata.AAC.5
MHILLQQHWQFTHSEDEPEEDSSSSIMMPSTRRPKMAAAATAGTHQNGSAATCFFPQAPPPSRPSQVASRPQQHPSPQLTSQPATWAPAASKRGPASGAAADLLVEEEVQVEDDGALPEAVGMPGRRATAPSVAKLTVSNEQRATGIRHQATSRAMQRSCGWLQLHIADNRIIICNLELGCLQHCPCTKG